MVDNIAATAHIALTKEDRQRLITEFDPIIASLAVTADDHYQSPLTRCPSPTSSALTSSRTSCPTSRRSQQPQKPKTDNSWFPQSWTENNASHTTDCHPNGGKTSCR